VQPFVENAVKASTQPSRTATGAALYLAGHSIQHGDTCRKKSEEAVSCMKSVGSKMVLCVDDEAIGLRVRKIMLESHGFQVLTARDGEEGLSLFDKNSVDLVVLDYYMPGLNGAEVAAEMRRRRPKVPIIFLSAYFSLPPSALELADAFLTKGDPPDVLIGEIEKLV
jgi:CheY-like chemotaxis protein